MSYLRTVKASIWAGWQRDFGWTSPVTGLSLRTIGPIASVMIAATVYYWGSTASGSFSDSKLAYILVGAALYAHISAYAWVPTMAIAEGKWTNVFPLVFISPRSSPPYVAGRCLASFLSSTLTSLTALVAAYFISASMFQSGIPLLVTPFSITQLILALIVNIFASMGLGFALGAYTIFASKFEWALPMYISGVLMVFSEALFPVSFLPRPLSDFGDILPFTAFIRASREAIIYGSASAYFSNILVSLVGGIIFLFLGLLAFRLAEEKARMKGIIDRKVV